MFQFEYQSSYYSKPERDLFRLYNFIKDSPLYYKEQAENIFEKQQQIGTMWQRKKVNKFFSRIEMKAVFKKYLNKLE